jgi:dihydroxyacid dehydratase/phosphogluconate dehydratase
MAIGGSTNAIIHLVAMAGRAGIKLGLNKRNPRQVSRKDAKIRKGAKGCFAALRETLVSLTQ